MQTIFKTLLLISLLQACNLSEAEKKELLPLSSGTLAEIVVVTDVASADDAYKKQISEVFTKDLIGQPPPGEQMFKVMFGSETFFKGYFKTHHNIFVFLTPESAPALSKVIDPALINKLVEAIKTKPNSFGVARKDVYAINQNMFFVLAQNKEEMVQKLRDKKRELLEIALNNENETGSRKLCGEKSINKDIFYTKSMTEKGYAVRKPASYRVAINNSDFSWLRKVSTTKELAHNIILFSVPYTSKDQLTKNGLIAIRNQFTKKYIPGPADSSYMSYSSVFNHVIDEEDFKGKYSEVIRGWWDVKGDFMGGPSYIRAVVDESKARIIFAEGFLYYPNEDKAVQLRELELLVNTLTIK